MSAAALGLGSVLVTAPMATAGGGDTQRVRLADDCEPSSFNAAIGPGTCVGDGDTTFGDFLQQLSENGFVANESADHWRFQPGEFHIDEGDRLRLVNTGGEDHTFTPVPHFGAGCVPPLNDALGLSGPPVVDCGEFLDATTVEPGDVDVVEELAPGVHKFECLIHPWMQSVVTVRADDDDDDHSGHH